MDLQPHLDSIARITDHRVLPHAETRVEGTITQATIPVRGPNTGDMKDTTIRRYLCDQIRLQLEDHSVEARFKLMDPGTSYFAGGKEYPVYAVIIVSWWPKPKPTAHDELADQQKRWKGTRPTEASSSG